MVRTLVLPVLVTLLGGDARAGEAAAPAADARAIGARAASQALVVELTQVVAWCDHMPIMGPGERRQYLKASVTFTNKGTRPLQVALSRAAISFDPAAEGPAVRGLALQGADGRPHGAVAVTVAPGAVVKVTLRGDNLYPEGKHGATLYLTLAFSAARAQLVVRGSGKVQQTM